MLRQGLRCSDEISASISNLTPSYYLCRKRKAVHKTAMTDDKRLQSTLKRLNVTNIPGIEEVNIIKDDVVIAFQNPKGSDVLSLCSARCGMKLWSPLPGYHSTLL